MFPATLSGHIGSFSGGATLSASASPNIRRRRATLGAAIEAVFVLGPDHRPIGLSSGAAAWLITVSASFAVVLYPASLSTKLDIIAVQMMLTRQLADYFAAAAHPDPVTATSWLMAAIRIMPQRPFCDVVVEPHALSSVDGWPDVEALRCVFGQGAHLEACPENGRTLEHS